jgi:hypothetical protein
VEGAYVAGQARVGASAQPAATREPDTTGRAAPEPT